MCFQLNNTDGIKRWMRRANIKKINAQNERNGDQRNKILKLNYL